MGKQRTSQLPNVTPENYQLYRATNNICIIALLRCASLIAKRANAYPFPVSKSSAKKSFENGILDALKKQGYTITVLHDPSEYVKAQAEEKAARTAAQQKAAEEKAAADAKAKAEAERKPKPRKKRR